MHIPKQGPHNLEQKLPDFIFASGLTTMFNGQVIRYNFTCRAVIRSGLYIQLSTRITVRILSRVVQHHTSPVDQER